MASVDLHTSPLITGGALSKVSTPAAAPKVTAAHGGLKLGAPKQQFATCVRTRAFLARQGSALSSGYF